MSATPSADGVFALAAAAVLAVAAATVAAVPTGASTGPGSEVSFEPSVPAEYAFAAPTADGVATVDGDRFDRLGPALAAADPGETVRLRGRFDPEGPVVVGTPNLTIAGAGDRLPVVDGTGEGNVLVVNASGVTVERVWVRNAGYAAAENDAVVWVEGRANGTVVRDSRVTETTFGVWVDGARNVRLANNTIVGRESVRPLTDRGNGIQLWEVENATVVDNRITDVRDGIYYSWATGVVARDNTMWDLRYGVHYMYSDDCTLLNNTAFGNDVGYALMVSEDLHLRGNVAVNNTGRSGHGILLKSIDDTVVRGNDVVGNENGLFVYNSLNNTIAGNLVAGNQVGVHLAAGSVRERVSRNTFVDNGREVVADVGRQVVWNESVGNYWARATVRDVDGDGVGETRYRPAGLVEHVLDEHPSARVFVASPAFEAVRRAERTLPVVEAPGVVDYRPLADPSRDWRRYYDRD